MPAWEFERDGEIVKVDPSGPLIVRLGAAVDLALSAAIAGKGNLPSVRGLVAPCARQRSVGAHFETLVARVYGAVSVLSRPQLCSRATACFHRLYQEQIASVIR